MNDILNLNLPPDIFIDNDLLEKIVAFGIENYCFPEEVLSHFGLSPKYYSYWCKLETIENKQAAYIVDRLESMVNVWMSNSRARVHKSSDMKAIITSLNYLQERHDKRSELLKDEEKYVDGWV